MTIAAIREKLHEYIDNADDIKVADMYGIIKENTSYWDDEVFLDELDRRTSELESGKIKGITLNELKSKF